MRQQESMELYPSQRLLLYIVFCLALSVRKLIFIFFFLFSCAGNFCKFNVLVLHVCSFCGLIIFAIYKHELDEKPLITGLALFLGLSSSVLKGIHCSSSWPCSYQCWMGLSIVFKQLN